jgi:hypothetical protein
MLMDHSGDTLLYLISPEIHYKVLTTFWHLLQAIRISIAVFHVGLISSAFPHLEFGAEVMPSYLPLFEYIQFTNNPLTMNPVTISHKKLICILLT